MTDGIWLDILLFVVLVVSVFLLVRPGRAPAFLAARDGAVAEGGRAEGLRRLVDYYPRLARQAGFDPGRLAWLYWGGKVFMAILLPMVLQEILQPGWFWLLVALVLGFFVPDLWLLAIRRGRKRRITWDLSFFVDLMVSMLQAGLGIEPSFRRAGQAGFKPSHPLAQEVALASAELEAGQDQGVVFLSLAERTGVAELRGLAAALRSGARHGAAIESTLSAQADLLRVKRRERIRREIQSAGVKVIFPVFLCGFPVFLVIILFPAILEMSGNFSEMLSLFR